MAGDEHRIVEIPGIHHSTPSVRNCGFHAPVGGRAFLSRSHQSVDFHHILRRLCCLHLHQAQAAQCAPHPLAVHLYQMKPFQSPRLMDFPTAPLPRARHLACDAISAIENAGESLRLAGYRRCTGIASTLCDSQRPRITAAIRKFHYQSGHPPLIPPMTAPENHLPGLLRLSNKQAHDCFPMTSTTDRLGWAAPLTPCKCNARPSQFQAGPVHPADNKKSCVKLQIIGSFSVFFVLPRFPEARNKSQ